MGQSLQRTVALVSLVASGGVFASSCVTNESTLFIRACLQIPEDTCIVTPDVSSTTLLRGTLDPAQESGYNGVLLVGNQLVARGNSVQLRTETSRIEIQSADVTIYDSTLANQLGTTYSVPASGFVDPGTSTQPGFGLASVLLVDPKTAKAHAGETVVSSVILHGRTLGGIDVESGEWQFPIDIHERGSSCDLAPCLPGVVPADMLVTTCHPGFDTIIDCRQGCTCTPGLGDCAPLGCRVAKTGDATGFCGACTATAQCSPGTKCVIPMGLNTGYCQ